MRRAQSGSESGQTLIELLVAAAVALIIIGAVVDLTVSALHSQTDQTNRLTAQQDARVSLDRMRRQIHCGQSATVGGGGASVAVVMGSACSVTGTVTYCVVATTLKSSTGTCDATHGTPLITSVTSPLPFTVTAAGTGSTTLRSNVDTLPAATLPVVSISGFTGTFVVSVGASPTAVTCTGTSGTGPVFTGCTGGSGGPYSKGTWVTLSGNQQFTQVGVNLTVRSSAQPYRTFKLQDSIALRNTPQ